MRFGTMNAGKRPPGTSVTTITTTTAQNFPRTISAPSASASTSISTHIAHTANFPAIPQNTSGTFRGQNIYRNLSTASYSPRLLLLTSARSRRHGCHRVRRCSCDRRYQRLRRQRRRRFHRRMEQQVGIVGRVRQHRARPGMPRYRIERLRVPSTCPRGSCTCRNCR